MPCSFDSLLSITFDAGDLNKISFLDLLLHIVEGELVYSTYRKPLNTYNYTPANSNHPNAVFDGIVMKELCRLHRTNSTHDSFLGQLQFFQARLKDRGYNLPRVRHICEKFFNTDARSNGSAVAAPKARIIPFRLPYSHDANSLHIGQILRRHAHLLPHNILVRLKFIVCFLATPNLFRERFKRFI